MTTTDTAIQFVTMMATVVAAVAACLAAIWAKGIGNTQNEINSRLLALQDYVAIAAVPDPRSGKINLINTGKTNLYLWGFDMPRNKQRLSKPRLITAGTADASYYWIDPPMPPEKSQKFEFDFKLYITDEFDNKWISEHGGEAEPLKIKEGEKEVDGFAIKVWSYKTYKSKWSL